MSIWDFSGGSDNKESACNVGDLVWFVGQEGPLEKGTATHSSSLAWRISWTEESGGLQFMGSQRVGHDWATNTFNVYLDKEQNWKSHKTKQKEWERRTALGGTENILTLL